MDQFAAVCEEIANNGSRLRKVAILAEYLRGLSDQDLILAVQFLSTGPVPGNAGNHNLFEKEEKTKLSIGYSILRDALQIATGWDKDILSVCHAEAGDTGETTGLLLQHQPGSQAFTLQEANEIYQQLFRTRLTARKRDILVSAYRIYQPLTIKYFVKIITRGFRIGLMAKQVEEAVAGACDAPLDAVRDANNRLGDLARVALAARHGTLSEIEARLFHPMEFMLAKPLDHLEDLPEPSEWIIEDKYDGIRSQAHFDNGHVRIYSRGMEEVTHVFPEVVRAFERLSGNGLVDGEILAWRDGRVLNFNVLQQRLTRKNVRAALLAEIPVAFMAYDLLLRNGQLFFHLALEERRRTLIEVLGAQPMPLTVSPQHHVATHEEIDRLFLQARESGNEGLLLKRKGSHYEPAKRSGAWLKLKRAYGTLDVVITAAQQGSGRRATVFSDYTFAVRSGGTFVNVGKAYSGLTDAEVKELTKVLRAASTDRFGPVMVVRPEVVLEVAFDGIQKSSRHKSGYALRFPRILRWRHDKKPENCDDLARVEALYQASVREF
jgi:DNA ligase-1